MPQERKMKDIRSTCETFFIPTSHPHERLGIPLWCFQEAFPVGILADTFENGAYGPSKLLLSFSLFCRCGV